MSGMAPRVHMLHTASKHTGETRSKCRHQNKHEPNENCSKCRHQNRVQIPSMNPSNATEGVLDVTCRGVFWKQASVRGVADRLHSRYW